MDPDVLVSRTNMFKFAVKLARGQLIGLGFSEGNLRLLKEGKPIKFTYADLKLPWPGGMIVVYPTDEIDAMIPRLPDEWGVIKLNDDAMNHMRQGKPLHFETKDAAVVMFCGENEDAMMKSMASLIGPETENLSPTVDMGQHRHKGRPT